VTETPVAPEEVRRRADRVRQRIEDAGGDPDLVEIVAVTKGFGPWAIEAAVAAGLATVGESYVQEMQSKVGELTSDTREAARIHFIGSLQTNKVRAAVPIVDVWQSVDRPSLVKELAKRAPGAAVMLQLDIADVAAQGGCPLEQAPDLLALATGRGLDVVGVMAIGPQADNDVVTAAFRRAVAFADEHALPRRSLGMTGDLEAAVAAGTTMIRVGTALFGERPPR